MTKQVIKWMRRALLAILILLLLIISLLVGGLYTHWGLNTLVWSAQKALPQLHIESTTGAIFPSFSLHNVSFKDDEMNLDVSSKEITLAIDASCFLSPSVCIEQVMVDGLNVVLTGLPPASEEQEVEQPTTIEPFSSPISVMINDMVLSDISLEILGNKLTWDSFSSKVALNKHHLTIHPTEFNNVRLSLAETTQTPSQAGEQPQSQSNTASSEPIVLPEVYIPLDIELVKFDVDRFTLEGESPFVLNHLSISADAVDYDVNVQNFTLDLPQLDLDLQTKVQLKGDYPISLQANSLIKDDDLKGQKLAIVADGTVADLKLEAQMEGQVKADVKASIQPLQSHIPFNIDLNESYVQWPLMGAPQYTVDIAHLHADGSLDGYQFTTRTQVDGEAIPHLNIEIDGAGDLNQIELTSLLLGTLGGEVSGQMKANWQAPLDWQANLQLSNIQPGLEWAEAEGVINGSLETSGQLFDSGGWQIELPKLNIKGVIREYPLTVEGSLFAADNTGNGDLNLDIKALNVAHGLNGIAVSGTVNKRWDLKSLVQIPQLSKSIPDAKGALNGDIVVRGDLRKPIIQSDLVGENIAYLDMLSLSNLKLNGDVSPLPAPSGDMELSVSALKLQEQLFDSINLAFSGSQQDHQLSLNVISDLINTDIQVTGGLQDTPENAWKGAIKKAEVSTAQGPWKLDQQVKLGFLIDKQIAQIQAHCWSQANASLCVKNDLELGQSGEVNLEISDFAFGQVSMFFPEQTKIKGNVDVSAWAKWSPDEKPQAAVSISLPKGQVSQQLEQPVILGWDSIALNARMENDNLQADWLIDLTNNGNLTGKALIEDVQSSNQEIDAQIVLEKINLQMLQAIIGEYSQLNADINSNLQLSGPVLHPRVNGQFTIDEMKVLGDITPVEVRSGKLSVDFSGYDAILNADIETPDGVLNIDGDASWQDLAAWQTRINVFSDGLNVDVPPMVKVLVKPDMEISLTPQLARIEGDIYLPWGRVTVEELPPSAVGVSSDEVILNKDYQPSEEGNPLPMLVETNVNIHIGDDFELTAFGLTGGLVGRLNVAQKDKGPFVVGEIEITDGVYRSFGQDLIIDEGKVLMNGPVDQPYLAIEATRNPDNIQDDVVVGIKVTGPANEPSIEVFSEPDMPQQNALSYLLRGQDIDASGGGNSMTTMLIGLSIAKSGNVVGKIGETFGVSDLQLDTQGAGDDSQVTVSGYITPDIQVKYGVGIFDSIGEFTVRYRLLTDLYLEAISGVDSAVDVLYQFEFD